MTEGIYNVHLQNPRQPTETRACTYLACNSTAVLALFDDLLFCFRA